MGRPKINLTGRRFGKLTVISPTNKRYGTGSVVWKCRCTCGNIVEVPASGLLSGSITRLCCYVGSRTLDLRGKRFGRLVAMVPMKQKRKGFSCNLWLCKCDCGKTKLVPSFYLRMKVGTKSCGCLLKEARHTNTFKHGCSGTTEHITWQSMQQRCFDKRNHSYKDYGGRGIKIYSKWLGVDGFVTFLQYLKDNRMYPKPVGMSMDRIDNDGNYEPGNIRWATAMEQANNKRISR